MSWLGIAPFARAEKPAAALQIDKLLQVEAGSVTRSHRRYYRADAVILVLSIPLIHRSNVGSGTVSVEEAQQGTRKRTGLRFAAGSLPERCRGLNRLGFLHEIILEEENNLREAAYFGFITSSPEESFLDARRALGSSGKNEQAYTVIDAASSGVKSRSSVAHLLLPPSYNWSDIGMLVGTARRQAHSSDARWRESTWPTAPKSFLYVVAQAIRAADSKSSSEYVYNEKRYRLSMEKARDQVQGEKLAQAGLTNTPLSVHLCKGEILNESTGHKTPFSLWVEEGSAEFPIPLRIEFQPKSFLKLAFEWDRSLHPVEI